MNQHVSDRSIPVRPFKEEDAPALADLHKRAILATYPSCYTQDVVEAWANSRAPERYLKAQERGEQFLVYELEGKPLGFISWKDGELCAMYVDPDHHKQGIGSLLTSSAAFIALQEGKPLSWVKAALPAQGFYEKMGFVFKEFGTSQIGDHTIQDVLLEYRLPE
ncbi:MAG: GNAT family N-acetyltransferase [Blastochloris viridis]|uniref:GNAT family N-acetyltransferase n=1 Tax=Blastochloris viridis TaxID=1079 RepID=A0A6N4R3R2_BLAVI|nr:MAG: GNAT family N-acetyltransferase [Blastochloris viridis]